MKKKQKILRLKINESCGNFSNLAKKVNVSRSHISNIVLGVRLASPILCFEIEKATDGMVSRFLLRSDIFGQHSDK